MDFKLIFVCLLISMKTVLSMDKDLSCAVCRALIDEVNYKISQVDPKKKIQVGSYRVDSRGNQGTYEKPYAKSEIHLIEVFETICDSFRNYAETTNIAGQKSVGRTEAREGKTLKLSNIKIGAETGKQLKHRCESLIEEYEDDIITVLTKDDVQNLEKVLCVEVTDQCTEIDIQIPMPITEYDDEKDAEDSIKKEKEEEEEETDEELVNSYLEDISGVPADTVMEQTVDEQKEEL